MRASALCAIMLATILAGCAGPIPVTEVEPPGPVASWSDVQAAPDGFAGSEVSMAVDPNDPSHVVAAAHSGGFGVYESFDGGRNWTAERLTATGLFQGDPQPGMAQVTLSDPAVAFSPDGTLHIAGLAFIPTTSVFVATRGADGTWHADTVWQSEIAGTMNDKEWLGISPAGTMVVAWQREPAMDQLRGVEQGIRGATGQHADIDIGQIVFSRSTDGGATWTLPAYVGDSLHANGTQVAFAPDGTGYMAWVDYEGPRIQIVRSTDDGATWSDPEEVDTVDIVGSFPDFGRMHTLPGMAVGPDGSVYITWHDKRNGDADILLAHDSNGTWQTTRVPDGVAGDVQLYPWVAVDGDGTAHVTYYGARNGTSDFAYRHVAYTPGGGFDPPQDVSDGTFTIFDEGDGAADIGDYTATAAYGDGIYAAWARPTEDGSFIHVGHRSTA